MIDIFAIDMSYVNKIALLAWAIAINVQGEI